MATNETYTITLKRTNAIAWESDINPYNKNFEQKMSYEDAIDKLLAEGFVRMDESDLFYAKGEVLTHPKIQGHDLIRINFATQNGLRYLSSIEINPN